MPNADDRWREQLANDLDYARNRLVEDGHCLPVFIVHAPAGLLLFPANFTDAEAEQRSAQLIRMVCAAYDAEAVGLVTEAWVRRMHRWDDESPKQMRARGRAVAPKDDPDRMEVVMAVLSYRGDDDAVHTLPAMAEIQRDAAGKPIGAEAVTPSDGMSDFSGTLTQLLPAVRLDRAVREELLRDLSAFGITVEAVGEPPRLH